MGAGKHMEYQVKKISDDFEPDVRSRRNEWDMADVAGLNSWPWNRCGRRPFAEARLLWSRKRLYVRFQVKEEQVLARRTEFQSPVCHDSCVELFVSANGMKYFNFEINCIGTLLAGYGPERRDRIRLPHCDARGIYISTSLPRGKQISVPKECPADGYMVEYSIPFSLFGKYSRTCAPKAGDMWKGNFYKCADELPEPHWGCWSPVRSRSPDFHKPEHFGKFLFVS